MVHRFRSLDAYRVEREWARYEGNALRDLFRELRLRFLRRHAVGRGWALDVGSGPGRFALAQVTGEARPVLLDLSIEMLRRGRATVRATDGRGVDLVRGNAALPPFSAASFAMVVVLGNVLGYLPNLAWPSLDPLGDLVASDGRLLIEIVPGWGERSAYLSRLPAGAVARLLRSPVGLVRKRTLQEGFLLTPPRHGADHGFRRLPVEPLVHPPPPGWEVREVLSVAPALGFDRDRLEAIRKDGKSWQRLLELEEELGRLPERWPRAAALLVALRRK